jgi:hypothetical protein
MNSGRRRTATTSSAFPNSQRIYKLDTFVFSVRQLYVPLDAPYFRTAPERPNDKTFREMLTEHSEAVLRRAGTRFYDLIGRKGTEAVREAALTHNLPSAPADHDHGELRNGPATIPSSIAASSSMPNAARNARRMHLA